MKQNYVFVDGIFVCLSSSKCIFEYVYLPFQIQQVYCSVGIFKIRHDNIDASDGTQRKN